MTLSHGRKEMARAVAEGIGYAMRYIREVMGENGYRVAEMTVAGNLARHPVLNQIKADVTGCRMLVPVVLDAELIGGACIGLVEEGIFADEKEAAAGCIAIQREYEPNPQHEKLYGALYGLYREVYGKLEQSFSQMASLRKMQADAVLQGRKP